MGKNSLGRHPYGKYQRAAIRLVDATLPERFGPNAIWLRILGCRAIPGRAGTSAKLPARAADPQRRSSLQRGALAPRGTLLQTATKQMVRPPLRCFDIAPRLRC
jgi:hypothetical protein